MMLATRRRQKQQVSIDRHDVRRRSCLRLSLEMLESRDLPSVGPAWGTFNHDAQHSGLSPTKSDSLDVVRWQTSVDLIGGGQGTFEHYGSPVITAANTVIIPTKTTNNTHRIDARRGVDGTRLWTQPTDYRKPLQTEIHFSAALTPTNRLYYSGVGGTVYYCDNPDQPGASATGQMAFYGMENYDHSLDTRVFISTPITSDSNGNIFFGFIVKGSNSLDLTNGIARISSDGSGRWIAASRAANAAPGSYVIHNSGPALSLDESVLYVAIRTSTSGRLVALHSTTLLPINRVVMIDPSNGGNASMTDFSTASPTVGPDGDVYFGVTGAGSKGWMLHYSADLTQTRTPGGFGWDSTASIVPRTLVPSYNGPSEYLITTKYNNYDLGIYRVAVLDPNVSMIDPFTGVTVMNEILTIDSPSRFFEWCINASAVDRATKSVFINNADGKLYRWDLTTNTLSESIQLSNGYFEAYTPTLIGPDGTVYAINKSALYAVQEIEPIPSSQGMHFDASFTGSEPSRHPSLNRSSQSGSINKPMAETPESVQPEEADIRSHAADFGFRSLSHRIGEAPAPLSTVLEEGVQLEDPLRPTA